MKPTNDDPREGKQDNLAEGERDTVEESIRIHEQKHDLPAPAPKKKKNAA